MNLKKDRPVTYLGMNPGSVGVVRSASVTLLPMTDEEKAEAKEREANKLPFGFGIR